MITTALHSRFTVSLSLLGSVILLLGLPLAGAPLRGLTASKAAQELSEKGRVSFRVNGQPRLLILASGEVALPRGGVDAAALPAGVQLAAADAQHRILRLPSGAGPAQWLETSRARAQSGVGGLSALAQMDDIGPVFYEVGREGDRAARLVATGRLLMIGADAAAAGNAAAMTGARGYTSLSGELWVLDYASPYLMLAAAQALESAGSSVEPQFTRWRVKRAAPNDPLYNQQFYFKNTGQGGGTAGEDLNIEGLWPSANGSGVTVAVVDDGLELAHPDLAPNMAEAALHRDVLNDTSDPTPPAKANHGTICAGFIAARGNNGIGITGAAPLARLIGIRLLGEGATGDSATDIQEAAAFAWRTDVIQISSNSWGPNDDAETVSGPDTAALAALRAGVTTGRGGRGVLYFVAAGNGRDSGDHAGWDGYSGSRYVFAIGATDNRGRQASFSESGPQLLATAVGQTSEDAEVQLLAADNVGDRGANTAASPAGDYTTSGVQGTSYATPQISGVAALLLQANANLGWRDVKEILIRSARKNDATDADWINNGAGFQFNHKYGAGFVNATAALALSRTWTPLAAERSVAAGGAVDLAIPDNAAAGAASALSVAPAAPLRVETVEVTVSVTHPNRGQLRFELTSPAGTRTVLGMPRSADTGANLTSWTFSTPRHWGENAAGTWTVRVVDTVAGATGSLTLARVTLYGSEASAPPSAPSIASQPAAQTAVTGGTVTFSVSAGGSGPLAYQWRKDGTALAGATNATLTLGSVQSAQAGSYSVVVSNSLGSVTSNGATLTVATGPLSRLGNLSVRTTLGVGQNLIVGFVMSGGSKPILLRAVGPQLKAFGLTDAHPDPVLELYDGNSRILAQNDDWGGEASLAATFSRVGAFALESRSLDAALTRSFEGGGTALIKGNGSGVVLVELYDAGAGNSPRLANVSARNYVGTGGDLLIAGFVVDGAGPKTVLIRAVGPTLAAFGVQGALADPKLQIFQGERLVAENDDWSPSLATAFGRVGAFSLVAGSFDAALTLTLQPGAYTAQITGVNGGTGEALVEIYELGN